VTAANNKTACGNLKPPKSPPKANLANNIAQAQANNVNGLLNQARRVAHFSDVG
jgi:hypothetical protein